MAGMTHMQHAQPILLSHFLLAHAEAFARDVTRLQSAAAGADACPMGSGALAGNSFAIDRAAIARDLGFSKITANSLDAVSDRDFALDYLFALCGIATHLSRLAEDFVLFASQEFSYVILPDEYSTGSSLMPQKKNPDCWELIRGKTGRITGALVALLTTLKGLAHQLSARFAGRQGSALLGARSSCRHALALLRVRSKRPVIVTTVFALRRFQSRVAGNGSCGLSRPQGNSVSAGARSCRQSFCKKQSASKRYGPSFRSKSFAKFLRPLIRISQEVFLWKRRSPPKNVPGGTAIDSVRAAIAELEARLSQRSFREMTQSPPESALPKGFRFAATACGLKKTGALDLALISSDVPASAAAVFTQNLVVAAPVTLSKKNLQSSKGRMRAVVVNAGNANCATGREGDSVAQRTNEEAAKRMLARSSGTVRLLYRRYRCPASRGKNSPRAPVPRSQSPLFRTFLCGTVTRHLHHGHTPQNRLRVVQDVR